MLPAPLLVECAMVPGRMTRNCTLHGRVRKLDRGIGPADLIDGPGISSAQSRRTREVSGLGGDGGSPHLAASRGMTYVISKGSTERRF